MELENKNFKSKLSIFSFQTKRWRYPQENERFTFQQNIVISRGISIVLAVITATRKKNKVKILYVFVPLRVLFIVNHLLKIYSKLIVVSIRLRSPQLLWVRNKRVFYVVAIFRNVRYPVKRRTFRISRNRFCALVRLLNETSDVSINLGRNKHEKMKWNKIIVKPKRRLDFRSVKIGFLLLRTCVVCRARDFNN